MMTRFFSTAMALIYAIYLPVAAQAPSSLSVQGQLMDTLGNPIDTSGVDMTFKLYKNGMEVWSQTKNSVEVSNGVFSVRVGNLTLLDTVAFNQPMELGVAIGADPELVPRTQLAASAFALGVRGMYAFWAETFTEEGMNVVAGSPNNSVAAGVVGATIAGGGGSTDLLDVDPFDASNAVTASWATVGGGKSNTSEGESATIGGGTDNLAGFGAVVGGGEGNEASGSRSTVAGGAFNKATGRYAAIPGGISNDAEGRYSFAAGSRAKAEHTGTFVWADSASASGTDFTSTGVNQFLIRAGGGVGIGTTSPNREVTVFDRDDNGDAVLNLKAGDPVNRELLIGVNQSTGGLISMQTNNHLDLRTDGNSRIRILNSGEVGIETTSPSHPLEVGTNTSNGNGAHVTAGGTWTSTSSRAFKEDLHPVDPEQILQAVIDLPLYRWRYKGSHEGEHMGPTAEDFFEAFELGKDKRFISGVDGDGVALAAIQGLYRLVKELQAENERMREMMTSASTAND